MSSEDVPLAKGMEGWEGAFCRTGALSFKGQHEADVFVMSLYYVLLLSCILFVCCQWRGGWLPSPIALARCHVSE